MAQPSQPAKTPNIAKFLPAITIAIALAYAGAAYFLLFLPKLAEILPGGALDVSAYANRIVADEDYLKRLDAVKAAYGKMNPERKQKVSGIVPVDLGVPDVFVQTDAIASKNGLVLVSIDAVPDDKSNTSAGRKTIRVSANVAGGTYPQFKAFLADLENALRLSDAQTVVFSSGSGNFGIVFKTYYLEKRTIGHPLVAPTAK